VALASTPIMERAVDKFIARENITRFEAKLMTEKDPVRREQLRVLLAGEKAKLDALKPT
jgi:hypothetical protein